MKRKQVKISEATHRRLVRLANREARTHNVIVDRALALYEVHAKRATKEES